MASRRPCHSSTTPAVGLPTSSAIFLAASKYGRALSRLAELLG